MIKRILIGFLLVILIFAYLEPFKVVIVEGESMLPTLQHGDMIIVLKKQFKTGDIVIIEHKKSFIKRVIGVEGDTLEFKLDGLYINNKKRINYEGHYKGKGEKIIIPKDYIFVIGDNFKYSKDSLFNYFHHQEYLIHKDKVKFVKWKN